MATVGFGKSATFTANKLKETPRNLTNVSSPTAIILS